MPAEPTQDFASQPQRVTARPRGRVEGVEAHQEPTGLAAFWSRHGTKVLLVLIVAALAFVIVRQRTASAERDLRAATLSLTVARRAVAEIDRLPAVVDAASLPGRRDDLTAQARHALDDALRQARRDPDRRSGALLARGDLNLTLAQQPQPPLEPQTLLAEAAADYEVVLTSFSDRPAAAVAARFGLAAVAEERGQLDVAREQYRGILALEGVLPAHRSQAEARLAILGELAGRPRFGEPPAPEPLTPEPFTGEPPTAEAFTGDSVTPDTPDTPDTPQGP